MNEYTEFAVGVTVWSLEEPEHQPCPELHVICTLLGTDDFNRSPAESYPSPNPMCTAAATDPQSIIQIDITGDPADQMEVAAINVRCKTDVADGIEKELRKIQSRSEIKIPLRRGNLGWNGGAEPKLQ